MALCDVVLSRYEASFGADLVRKAFSFIKTSRFGMGEAELLHMLDVNVAPAHTSSASLDLVACVARLRRARCRVLLSCARRAPRA
jgi:hypothetical protein